jgi:type II secretory pathway component PulF
MDGSLGAFNMILLAVPGIALKIAVRAFYGRRRLLARDPLEATLSLAGTLLIVLAVLGTIIGLIGVWWLLIVLGVLLLIAYLMVVDRLRRAEHKALLWSLATAAEKGIPLSEAARAYADETMGHTGARAMRLAQALEQGQPLPAAAEAARLRMNPAMRLAVGLGESLGTLGPAMKQQLDDAQQGEGAVRDSVIRFAWLGLVVIVMAGINTFVMLKIVPVYVRMFEEFELELPGPTVMLIEMCESIVQPAGILLALAGVAMFLLVVLLAAGLIILLIERVRGGDKREGMPLHWRIIAIVAIGLAILIFIAFPFSIPILMLLAVASFLAGWLPRDLPVVWRIFRRYDGALVMRGLAVGIRRGLPLPQALAAVTEHYPIRRICRLLGVVSAEVAFGHVWQQSLERSKLISAADAAVLAAAERVGNLPWALEEMADSAIRRQLYRTQVVLQFLFPPVLVLIGGFVAFVMTSLFLPLIALIQGLT